MERLKSPQLFRRSIPDWNMAILLCHVLHKPSGGMTTSPLIGYKASVISRSNKIICLLPVGPLSLHVQPQLCFSSASNNAMVAFWQLGC